MLILSTQKKNGSMLILDFVDWLGSLWGTVASLCVFVSFCI